MDMFSLLLSILFAITTISIEFDDITVETVDNQQISIGWIKILSCTENTASSSPYTSEFTWYHGVDTNLLAANAMTIKFTPNTTNETIQNEYTVFAKPNSNPIISLNDYKEVSFHINPTTGYIDGTQDISNWIGSDNAKSRLSNTLSNFQTPRSIDKVMYEPWDGSGLIINQDVSYCQWNHYVKVEQDIDVYFGFSVETDFSYYKVSIKACNGWNYGSHSNTFQIQLKGSNGSSPFYYVNQVGTLPKQGEINDYYIDITGYNEIEVGDIYSVVISVNDEYGYCIKGLNVTVGGINKDDKLYEFNSENYFGTGIILSNYCPYSFRYLGTNYPLISCMDDYLELNTYSSRGIYELDIHTCINSDSGMAAGNMKENVYAVLMGKKHGEHSYTTTSISFLDHYVAGDVNIHQLGHFIAGNVKIASTASNALYSSKEGKLIGIKIEIVNFEENTLYEGAISITIDSTILSLYKYKLFEEGRYLIVFFDQASYTDITKSSQIYIYNINSVNSDDYMNIYVILAGNDNEYQLPFAVEYRSVAKNWFDANDICQSQYDTTLASIHSEEQQFLIDGMTQDHAWIGFIDLTLEDQNNWVWNDGSIVDYTNWKPNEPNNQNGEDCAHLGHFDHWSDAYKSMWNDQDCGDDVRIYYFVCASPNWNINTNRRFEINDANKIDDITIITIGNNNNDDNICIDSISLNDKSSVYISNNYIGGNSGVASLNSIFQYPVCSTEVIGMRVDYDTSKANIIPGDSMIAGLECSNNNRIISSTCSISQTYELTKTTTFSISNEDSSTNEYSWGTSSSLTLGVTRSSEITQSQTNSQTNQLSMSRASSQSTTNEFSFGFNREVSKVNTVGGEAGGGWGPFSASVSASRSSGVSVGKNQQWTSTNTRTSEFGVEGSYSKTNENSNSQSQGIDISNEKTNEENKQNTQGTSSTNGFESSYETSETVSVECSAEMEIPPAHSVSYSLIFNAINTTINTYTDLKLTLCSAFLNPLSGQDETHYVYINNIPGVIKNKETKACEVQFEPAQYIRNDILCDEEQQLAISAGSNYIPQCKSTDSSLYDGCQCDIGDSRTLAVCWCVDENGNKISGKATQVRDGVTFEQVCINKLKCENTEIVLTTTTTTTHVILEAVQDSVMNNSDNINPAFASSLIILFSIFIILFAILFAIFIIIYGYSVYKTNKSKNIEELKAYNNDTKNLTIPVQMELSNVNHVTGTTPDGYKTNNNVSLDVMEH